MTYVGEVVGSGTSRQVGHATMSRQGVTSVVFQLHSCCQNSPENIHERSHSHQFRLKYECRIVVFKGIYNLANPAWL